MRDKKLITQDIVQDCATLPQTKYLIPHSLSKQTLNTFLLSFLLTYHCQIPPKMVTLLLDFTSAEFHLIA